MHQALYYIAVIFCIVQSQVTMAQQQFNGNTKGDAYASYTPEETNLINTGRGTMHVYLVTDEKEHDVLKAVSKDVDPTDPLTTLLAKRMLSTVQDEAHPGVGIAAPQVGINKNLIWVQRFDKSGEPFEAYVNPKIVWRSKLIRTGAEGCLSIPEKRDDVERSYAIRIQYVTLQGEQLEENIEGFTAVIFQHEIDHLFGILFPERVDEQEATPSKPIGSSPRFSAKEGAQRL